MPARSPGVSGIGVAIVGAGAFLMYAAIKDVPPLQGLRDLLSGKPPDQQSTAPAGPTGHWYDQLVAAAGQAAAAGVAGGLDAGSAATVGGAVGGASIGAALVGAAAKYLGRPYQWGHTFATPTDGGDCSGLVLRAFNDIGIHDVPRTSRAQGAWPRLARIPRQAVTTGDLVWWNGHIAIATDNVRCIQAPRPGLTVGYGLIDKSGPTGGKPQLCLRYRG